MRRVIFNQKGGVGKTSISCNLAAAFVRLGRKTLLIDLDTQGNASRHLLGTQGNPARSIADFFEGTLSLNPFATRLADCMVKSNPDGLYVIPAAPRLSDIQSKLEARYKIRKLADALTDLTRETGIQEVIIDTPPALNFFTVSAMIAADRLLIPFDCDSFSADAVHRVLASAQEIQQDHNPSLVVEGVVVNQFQKSSPLPRKAVAELAKAGIPILEPWLSSAVAMRESHHADTPLVLLKPGHSLSKDFVLLAYGLLGLIPPQEERSAKPGRQRQPAPARKKPNGISAHP